MKSELTSEVVDSVEPVGFENDIEGAADYDSAAKTATAAQLSGSESTEQIDTTLPEKTEGSHEGSNP